MGKRALLVGCNYPGTRVELRGCANDVKRMHRTLISRFGFTESDIMVLLDTEKSRPQPTGANIRSYLAQMISGLRPGDVLVFHYSGHGTQVPAEGVVDETGAEEAIVPTDMNLLTDDDFRDLVIQIPRGVTFTFISDSCHSGGLIDSAKEQIGASSGVISHSHHGFTGGSQGNFGGGSQGDFGGGVISHSHHGFAGGSQGNFGGGSQGNFGGGVISHSHHGFAGGSQDDFGGGGGLIGLLLSQGLQALGNFRDVGDVRDVQTRHFPSSHGSTESRFEERVIHYQREGHGEPQGQTHERHGGRHSEWGHPPEGHEGRGHHVPVEQQSCSLKSREIPVAVLTQLLSERSGHRVDVGNIRTTLYDMFGNDASPAVKMFAKIALEQLLKRGRQQEGIVGAVSSLATQFLESKLQGQNPEQAAHYMEAAERAYRPMPRQGERPVDVGILLSGCQSDETSADARPAFGESYGAFSNAIQTVLNGTRAPLSNRELVLQVRRTLRSQGFKQHPCLYCSDRNVDAVFICH